MRRRERGGGAVLSQSLRVCRRVNYNDTAADEGRHMASMQDIAERAGVSRATVSRVLSGHPSVKASTRKKVMHWVDELGYEPDVIAQSLAGGSTSLIGVVLPEIAYPFFSEILEAMEDQAFVHGHSIIVCNSRRSLEKERNVISELSKRRADGIIAVPVSPTESAAAYRRLRVPTVMITKRVEGFDSIFISHEQAGQQMAKHFLSMGFSSVGYIGPVAESTSAIKYRGFCSYLHARGIEVSDVIECPAPANMNASCVYNNVRERIASKGLGARAYFSNDDITACEAIAAMRDAGYTVPEDVAVAGFDNSLLAREMSPKLTSLAQPLEEIGRRAVDVLLDRIASPAEPQLFELTSRVVARASTLGAGAWD